MQNNHINSKFSLLLFQFELSSALLIILLHVPISRSGIVIASGSMYRVLSPTSQEQVSDNMHKSRNRKKNREKQKQNNFGWGIGPFLYVAANCINVLFLQWSVQLSLACHCLIGHSKEPEKKLPKEIAKTSQLEIFQSSLFSFTILFLSFPDFGNSNSATSRRHFQLFWPLPTK